MITSELTLLGGGLMADMGFSFDYNFCLDGTIETVVRTSDYIQSAFYANNTEYGYQIHDSVSLERPEMEKD